MSTLNLEQASKIVDTALAKARELGLKPLTVVVLDDGGNVKVLKREDGPGAAFRPSIAMGKAWGAVGMGVPSRVLEQRAQERPHFINALVGASKGRLVPVAGGVLIRDAAGTIIGSVGISGDTSDNDEICAVAGIEAAGLTADTG
jgi:uncharacterized protein GlcG (DUF336 family)